MNRKKLRVHVVHQFAHVDFVAGGGVIEHKILGVYLDRNSAEAHRKKIENKGPYVAVTKHTVRGSQSKLLGTILDLTQ